MSKAYILLAALLGLISTRCDMFAGGAGAGNPPLAEVVVSFKANSLSETLLPLADMAPGTASGATFTVRDSLGADFILTAIEVSVRGIGFGLPEGIGCDNAPGAVCDSGEVETKGAFLVDLMTGSSNPPLGRIRLPEGLYKKVKLDLDGGEGGSRPSEGGVPAFDSSRTNMVITGRTHGATGPARRFALKLDLQEGLVFEKPDGLPITNDSLNTILLQLTVDGWLQGVDLNKCLDAAAPDSAGTLILSGDGFCGGGGSRIRRNIEGSGDLDEMGKEVFSTP